MARSLAFKCTHNDGVRLDGPASNFVGFRGTCSRDLIAHNVRHHVWCSQPENRCKQFDSRGMKGRLPEFPCLESELFQEWKFGAGAWHHGPNKGKTIPIRDTAVGKIVILTTRRPDQTKETQRRIIGAYEIGDVDDEQNLIAHPKYRIRLSKGESDLLPFWRYHMNANGSATWKTGLVRYLEDAEVHSILSDMAAVCGGSQAGDTTKRLLARCFANGPAPEPRGAMGTDPAISRLARARKYPGGEGKDHLQLKLWVAKHPAAIGLPPESLPEIEHSFESGDCVDIAFSLPDGSCAVVEIETCFAHPGAHQAIKYRALLAAQRRWSLGIKRVQALLVAWEFGDATLEFCRQYDIQTWKCRRGATGEHVA